MGESTRGQPGDELNLDAGWDHHLLILQAIPGSNLVILHVTATIRISSVLTSTILTLSGRGGEVLLIILTRLGQ